MHWLARLCSVILTLVWLTITYFTVVVPEDPLAPHGWIVLALALLGCAALLAAWRWSRLGGGGAVATGIAYALISWRASLGSGPLAALGLLSAGPFVLLGLLFVVTDRMRAGTFRMSRPIAVSLSMLIVILVLAMLSLLLILGFGNVVTLYSPLATPGG